MKNHKEKNLRIVKMLVISVLLYGTMIFSLEAKMNLDYEKEMGSQLDTFEERYACLRIDELIINRNYILGQYKKYRDLGYDIQNSIFKTKKFLEDLKSNPKNVFVSECKNKEEIETKTKALKEEKTNEKETKSKEKIVDELGEPVLDRDSFVVSAQNSAPNHPKHNDNKRVDEENEIMKIDTNIDSVSREEDLGHVRNKGETVSNDRTQKHAKFWQAVIKLMNKLHNFILSFF